VAGHTSHLCVWHAGEERAIDSLKNGATDYILKERLIRLAPAVRRAMQEVEERAGNRRMQEALQETEQRLRIIFSQSPWVSLGGREWPFDPD